MNEISYIKQVKALTREELSNVYDVADDIIQNLPPHAITELCKGNLGDIDNLFDDILNTTNEIINNGRTGVAQFGGLPVFEKSFDDTLKIQSLNYFIANMLPNFTMGWRNIEFSNLIQLHPYSAYLCSRGSGKSFHFCFALPLWRMWRYRRPGYFQHSTADNKNSKDTVIITNESRLGEIHLEKITNEIKSNELLHDVLNPNGSKLGVEKIKAKNESTIELRSYGSSAIRGLHVGMVILDDFLDKSVIYSQRARDKFKEVFYGEVMSIVEPHGSVIVSGTPFHKQDLYTELKSDTRFKVFEYPVLDINGKLLAPDRYSFAELMERKQSMGSVVFSREYLVSPISDASSIFPWEYLHTSIINMEAIGYVSNIESFPIKMKRVVVSVDFAKSANVGADYTVIMCIGMGFDNNFYLIAVERGKGWSTNEQVSRIVRFSQAYHPHKIRAEDNGFQSVMIELVRQRGVKNIEGHTTTINKRDDLIGLPSISAMFERCEIKLPYLNDGFSKEMTDLILGEFNSIGYTDDNKLQSIGQHDDTSMCFWIGVTELRVKSGLKVHMID